MQTLLLRIVGIWLLAGFSSVNAAKIIWVVQEDGPAGIEFIEMLETEGHEVEIMVAAEDPPSTEQQDTMNAADLVVVSRKVNSGNGAYNTFVWNDTITTPLISHSPYILRTNDTERWQWMDGNGLADSVPSTVEANEPTHKLFEGIPLTDGVSPEWHFARDRNTSVSTDAVAKGGTAIATKTAEPEAAIIAAEWEADQVAVGPRMMLMIGSREPNPNEGIGADYGKFNLTEVGQIVYLNSISHYVGPWGAKHLWATFAKDLGEVDSAPGGQDVTLLVKNLGLDEPVNITDLSFTGAGKDFYTVKSAPESIAPTEVAEIVVTLDTNGDIGAFDAELVIESDSTMESIRSRTVAFSARALNFAGPAAHYTLDETEGEEILDVTGNQRHAMAEGVDLTVDSLVGGDGSAASFGGGQVTADLTDVGALTDFSIAFWMNASEGGDDLQTIVAKDDSGTPGFGILRAGNNLQWFVGDSAKYETSDDPITPGTAMHVVAIYNKTDNETLTLYVNGAQLAQESGLEPFEDFAESPFVIGSFNGVFSFNGVIDDVQIYSRLLEDEEVTSMFNDPGSFPRGGPPVVEPEPTGGWVLAHDFDGLEAGPLDGNGGWVSTDPGTTIASGDGGNALDSVGPTQNAYASLGGIIPVGSTGTVFFRARAGEMPDFVLGVSDVAEPGTWNDYEGYLRFAGTNIDVRDGGGFAPALENFSVDTWYNIWLVLDNDALETTLYYSTGDEAAQLGAKGAFRMTDGNTEHGDIINFLVRTGNAHTTGRLDDIYLASGENLTIPGGGGALDATGILGYWQFDEGEGAVAIDATGQGNNGAIVSPSWSQDATRGTVYQSGGGSYVDFGSVLPVISLESDFTWSFWVNADETSNNNIVLGNRYMADGNDFDPREFIKFTPSKFEWHFNAGGENAPDTPLVVGQWDHNLVVKSGPNLTYYRNGEVAAEGTITGAPANAQPFYLGGQPSNAGDVAENFSGLFDEVAVFSRALSADEVTQAYQLGLAGQPLISVSDPGPTTSPGSITSVTRDVDGNFSLTLPDGETADIEYSQDLISWETISSGVTGAYQDTDATRKAAPEGYYRAKQ